MGLAHSHQMKMISILVPSRGRPDNVRRLYKSLLDTTVGDWELLVRLDDDDPSAYDSPPHQTNIVGPRLLLSELWNDLVPYSLGDILMHGGDDITFNTPGWDLIVRQAFPENMIAFVHGDDLGGKGDKLGTHGFLSRKAVKACSYFMPPYFASDYNDLWWNEVYDELGRRIFVPIITEHHHPAFGKGEWDLTHQERIERHKAEDVDAIWRDTADKRADDVAKLRNLLA